MVMVAQRRGSRLYELCAAARTSRVVLAEDDGPFRHLLAAALARDGFEVVEVRDGRELVQRIASHVLSGLPVDLIISDIRMPLMTGLDALAGLRRAEWAIPVILITAWSDASTHVEAKRFGASAVFHKPFNLDDLRTMAAHLAGRKRDREPIGEPATS
jgi:DNA-binding NtrC family response regulator